MPKAANQSQAAYDKARRNKAIYNAKPAQMASRVKQNTARRQALSAGTVTKGDNTNVNHKVMLDKGGTNAKSNREVVSEKSNKGWRKNNPEAYGNKGK